MGRLERRLANHLDPRYKGIHLRAKSKFDKTKKEIEDPIEHFVEAPLSPTSNLMQQYRQSNLNVDINASEISKEMEKYEMYSVLPKDKDVLLLWKVLST